MLLVMIDNSCRSGSKNQDRDDVIKNSNFTIIHHKQNSNMREYYHDYEIFHSECGVRVRVMSSMPVVGPVTEPVVKLATEPVVKLATEPVVVDDCKGKRESNCNDKGVSDGVCTD